ncbi:hypothetical protein ScPMuIL_013316 [Solemya velum]
MEWSSLSERSLLYLRVIGLIIGCFAKFVTGSLFVFTVYEDAIKDMFNYTEKEVEMQSSLLNLGLGVGFIPGMFYDRFGPTWTSVVGLVISLTGYMLLWSTTKLQAFYRPRSWLMGILFFLTGLGSIFTYMVALNTNCINFDKKHRGKIIGLLNAFFSGSPSIFAVIYYNVFSHGESTDPANQDYGGFLLLFAVLFTISDILCIFLIRIYPRPEDEDRQELIIDGLDKEKEMSPRLYEDEDNAIMDSRGVRLSIRSELNGSDYDTPYAEAVISTDEKNAQAVEIVPNGINSINTSDQNQSGMDVKPKSLSIFKLLINPDFHLFTWMFSAAASIGLVYTNNITQVAKSVGLKQYDDMLVMIIPITSAIASLFFGILSDVLKDKIPRNGFIIIAGVLFAACQGLGMAFANNYAVLILSTVFCGLGIAIIWSLAPAVMSEMFDLKDFGRNWGLAILVAALIGMGAQEVFGALYDEHITIPGSNDCCGMACIRTGYAVFLGISILSVVMGIIIVAKKQIMAFLQRRKTVTK